MELYDIVTKLVGPIEPVGDSNVDRDRYLNLKKMTSLTDFLIQDIEKVSADRTRHEASMEKAGNFAYNFLRDIGYKD